LLNCRIRKVARFDVLSHLHCLYQMPSEHGGNAVVARTTCQSCRRQVPCICPVWRWLPFLKPDYGHHFRFAAFIARHVQVCPSPTRTGCTPKLLT
jgi:hypothetical protein